MSAQAQAPLLSTKLRAPDPRERIGRESLVCRLSDARGARLALIRAPAGWGKSTLLSQWHSAERGRRGFAWVTLDSSDSDPIRFWGYALEALRTAVPGLASRSLALLRAPGVDLVSEMLPTLVAELAERSRPLVLALDDYHQIEGNAVHAGMRRLLDYLPDHVCVAIATRTEPPLQVSRLRARGELVEVDADELRFSCAEARTLLNEFLALELADEDLAALHQRAEGWPAAVYLAGLSLRNRADRHEFIARFAGMTATSSTTWATRCSVTSIRSRGSCCCARRSSIGSQARSVMRRPRVRRASWRRSRGQTCSWSRSMTGASGIAITTCSAPA